MRISFVTILADAWAIARRTREVVPVIAGLFLFVPSLALQLLTPPFPTLPETMGDRTAVEAWMEAFGGWAEANAPWYALAGIAALYGTGAILALLLDRDRPDVRGALLLSFRLLPRVVLAAVLTAIPMGIGLWLLILPGLYVQARLIAALPALFAERPISATQSLARSLKITHRTQFALFGATVALLVFQWLAMGPLSSLAQWLAAPGRDNHFATALVGVLIAGVETLYRLGIVFAGVAAWRRLASSGT